MIVSTVGLLVGVWRVSAHCVCNPGGWVKVVLDCVCCVSKARRKASKPYGSGGCTLVRVFAVCMAKIECKSEPRKWFSGETSWLIDSHPGFVRPLHNVLVCAFRFCRCRFHSLIAEFFGSSQNPLKPCRTTILLLPSGNDDHHPQVCPKVKVYTSQFLQVPPVFVFPLRFPPWLPRASCLDGQFRLTHSRGPAGEGVLAHWKTWAASLGK